MQDAQKVCPGRPQRAKRRGGTDRTSCGPIAEKPLLNVELLSEARTPLAGFFSILLMRAT